MKKQLTNFICIFFLFSFSNLFSAIMIEKVTPIGDNTKADNYKAITITFNQQMISLKAINDIKENYLNFNIKVDGTYRWLSVNTLAFYPKEELPANTKIEVTLKKGIRSEVSGDILEEDYNWSFNTIRPTLVKSSPYMDQRDVIFTSSIVLYFNMLIDLNTAKNYIKLNSTLENKDLDFDIRYATEKDVRGWEIDYYDFNEVIVITPKQSFRYNDYIITKLNKGLNSTIGSLGLQSDNSVAFKVQDSFYFNGTNNQIVTASYSPLPPKIEFSSKVYYKDLIENLEITPQVQLPSEEDLEDKNWSSKSFSLYSIRFDPNMEYTIKVKKSLKDISGNTLTNDVLITLNVIDYNPRVSIPSGMGVVESYDNMYLPIQVINPNTININSRYVDKENIIPFLLVNEKVYRYDNSIEFKNYTNKYSNLIGYEKKYSYTPNVEKNRYITTALNLTNYLDRQFGFLSLEFDTLVGYSNEYSYKSASDIQVTSMGVTGKFAGDSNAIFVTDLKTGLPIEGATVEIRDDFNNILDVVKTDKNGTAYTKGFRLLNIKRTSRWSTPRQWAIVTKDDDISFINSDSYNGISPWRLDIDYDYYQEDKVYNGAMFTERGLYKPGEEVHIKGVIREKKLSSWVISSELTNATFEVFSSRDDKITEGVTSLNEYGSYLIDFKLPSDAPTGYYRVNVRFKKDISSTNTNNTEEDDNNILYSLSQSFRVEEYKSIEFESRIWLEDKNYYLGDTLPIKMSGWYLFGEPMANKNISYNISIRETSFTPPNNSGFRFNKLSWFEDEFNTDYFSTISRGEGVLNINGEYNIDEKIDISRAINAGYVTVEATVEGEDSQKVSSSRNVLIYGSDYYIGIKRQGYFLETDKETSLEFIATDVDGNRLENKNIEVKLIKRHWESVRKAITGGRFQWESKQIDTVIASTNITTTKDSIEYKFTPEKSGLYIVQARGVDSKNRQVASDEYMYVIGKDYAPWAMFDDDLLEVITEKEDYKPNETARIMVKSPYEKATAIVTVEREYVLDSFITNIEGTTALIEVPIKKEYLPNVYIGVSLVSGRFEDESFTNYATDEGKPSFKIGYAGINVSPIEKELDVKIVKSADVLEPSKEMTIDLYVSTKESKPLETEVMLSVVDLGVLNLIGYKTPNWFNTFYGKRPLGVGSVDTRIHLIGQRNYGEKGDTPGGDGLKAQAFNSSLAEFKALDIYTVRKNFLSTAFYQGRVKTDANGKATVTFKLPDNITSFRIMASAIDKDGYFGASDDVVVVKKNLMLLSTIPEFAYVDDKFRAGATVYNYSDKDLEVEVKAIYSNVVVNNSLQKVYIKKGDSADVRFDIMALKEGEANITIVANANEYSDALEKKFNIKTPMTTETVAYYSSTTNMNETLDIVIPDMRDVYTNVGSLDVYFSPSAFSDLTGSIKYLETYPYLCLEQQLSRAYPIITSKRLVLDMKLTDSTEESLNNTVSNVLNNIVNYQTSDGGFAYYPNKSWTSPWLTAYAVEVMLKAKKDGYSIDEKSLEIATEYLYKYVNSGATEVPTFFEDEYIDLSTTAYMAYVLSLANYKDVNTVIDRLYNKANNMPIYALSQLLKAMYYNKYSEESISKVRNYILNTLKEDSNTAHYELENIYSKLSWIHSSSVRDTAIVLDALIETGYDSNINEKVVRWLINSRKQGRYLNTQDNVSVFSAMNSYYKKYENIDPNFKAEFLFNNKTLLSTIFENRNVSSVYSSTALSLLLNNSNSRRSNFIFARYENTSTTSMINKDGVGRLYYGIRLSYAPRKTLDNRNAGIKVERYYETKSGRRINLNLESLKQGEEYVVVVKISSDYDRQFVVVDSGISSGMRILNSTFNTESSEVKNITGSNRWWGSFNYTENYNDRILLFADFLYKGEHTYKYVVRAITPGKYLLPATKAEEMYNSEVFGYDGQKTIIIRAK